MPSVDADEPRRIAEAAMAMKLGHVVITMVSRDDLPDGGAVVLADTVRQVRLVLPKAGIELLSSDLGGNSAAIELLVASQPDIIGHNLETVQRLSPVVRSRCDWSRSLDFLRQCKKQRPDQLTKSSLMLGLGETEAEILSAMDDLRLVKVDFLNLGQYLQPSRLHLAVQKYWHPDEFAGLRQAALQRGFSQVEAGPLVRSSYHAGQQFTSHR